MNIRIGDRVLILDRDMPKYCNKEGIVMSVGWTIKYKRAIEWKPKINDWFRTELLQKFDKDIIAFEVKAEGFPSAWFSEGNLVAYK